MRKASRALRWQVVVLGVALLPFGASLSFAAPLAGDLNGDGYVDAVDEAFIVASYGASAADPTSYFEPTADIDGNGVVDLRDVALYGTSFGAGGGDLDVTAPGLLATLNDVPDDMNDLLVVPPDGFQLTFQLDGGLGSAIDTSTISITSSEDMGAQLAGAELAASFAVTPTRAVWDVPPGTDLARTSHYVTVSVSDAAGNTSMDTYGFAVRDFNANPPMQNHQQIFLDFGQDRSLGPEIDFVEDLREYGLSTASKPFLETTVKNALIGIILERVNEYYGLNADGTPGYDAVDISFHATPPAGAYSRLCVGGESSGGANFLGNTIYDPENETEASDNCNLGSVYGVFPQAIYALWGANAELHAAFDPVDPDAGGVPLGDDPLDSLFAGQTVTAADLETLEALGGRAAVLANAVDAFTQVVATAIAHEVGHLLGLTAAGDAPAGLFGGTNGTSSQDHNVTPSGSVPTGNFLMNRGSSFTFEEMSGRGGKSLPVFRELNWAYLHDRVALNDQVTALYPAPEIFSISPNPAIYPGPFSPTTITIHGDGFVGVPFLPSVSLVIEQDPTPNAVTSLQLIDSQTLTGQIHPLFVPPGLYDVVLTNGDGQQLILVDYLDVQ